MIAFLYDREKVIPLIRLRVAISSGVLKVIVTLFCVTQVFHVGHLPVAFGYLGEQTLADAVKVEVHVARVSLLPYEEAVAVDEGDGLVIHALDVLLRAFVVDRALGAVGFAEDHLEGVLPAVEAEKVQSRRSNRNSNRNRGRVLELTRR